MAQTKYNSALAAMRKRRGLTQKELAHWSGVTRVEIINIETGKTPNPRVDTLKKLAVVLQCDISSIVGRVG